MLNCQAPNIGFLKFTMGLNSLRLGMRWGQEPGRSLQGPDLTARHGKKP